MESALLDDLASLNETVDIVDLQIRDSVESLRWSEGHRLSMMQVRSLAEKINTCLALRERLGNVQREDDANAASFRRCFDISAYLLDVLSKQLSIYRRIAIRLADTAGSDQHSSDDR